MIASCSFMFLCLVVVDSVENIAVHTIIQISWIELKYLHRTYVFFNHIDSSDWGYESCTTTCEAEFLLRYAEIVIG